ncbi:hypothetical protein F4054_16490 [Candidatus Poribacteria bacterium]|nr:hypothetical protein [Candidatus Poribacteria bacterium]MYK23840.1 hypothetical protein [Candidatus Poribacteria bacterium]
MFRDLLSSRLIQAGFAFFVLCVGGSLLYSWHVHRTTAAEFVPIPQAVESLKNKTETNTAPVDFQTEGSVDTPDANTDTPRPEATEALPNETETLDVADAFLPDDVGTEETPAEEVAVSPFGFGPYPEVPEDYPARPTWERSGYDTFSQDTQRELELLDRVLIKLWKQGERGYRGGSTDNGKVYPHYKNTAYVRYRTTGEGRRYIARYKGDPAIRISPEQLRTGELPSYIRVLDIDSEGIDPYEFLDLK